MKPPSASPIPPQSPAVVRFARAIKRRLFLPPGKREWIAVGSLVCVLVIVALPFVNRVEVRDGRTRELSYAKQVGLALKLYAADHDGVYPAGLDADGQPIRTANDAFRCLFPTYTQSEMIFANKRSAYQRFPADNVIVPAWKALSPGENSYAYIMGATDDMNLSTPLVADGTDGTGRGTYVSDPKKRGGVWSGTKTVIIHLDNSGTLENLTGPADARYVSALLPDGTKGNLLSPAALGPKLKLLDPAVPPSHQP